MKYFKRKIKEKTIQELIRAHGVCGAFNDIVFNTCGTEESVAYLNPRNQTCFNYGLFTKQDLKDWMNGCGKIIKGNTDEEKKKFWEHATFTSQSIFNHSAASSCSYFKKVKINKTKYRTDIVNGKPIKKENPEDLIRDVFGAYILNIVSEFRYRDAKDVKKEWIEISRGVYKTLHLMGYGWIGACNYPCSTSNLVWYSELVFAYAYFKYLEGEGTIFPDFEFVNNYKG